MQWIGSTTIEIFSYTIQELRPVRLAGRFIINKCMTVQSQFYDHLTEHSSRTGFTAPAMLLVYLAELLADRLDRTDIIPEPSFAERYLKLYSCHQLSEFKDYADSTLFFVSLMPEYGRKRGLDISYYSSLGISVYYTLGDLSRDSRFIQLGNWFYYLQKFLNSAITSQSKLDLLDFYRSDHL